jgi:CDP-glucose 4,6-dehydratase
VSTHWRDRNVFVTGGTGLLGPWLVKPLLEQGANVIVLVRDSVPASNFYRLGLDQRVTAVHGAVEDYPLQQRVLNEYEVDTIFHLAAQAIVGAANRWPLSSFESNIRGTWCVLEAARQTASVRAVVVASSDKAYGDQAQLPYTEDAPLAAVHPYDVSKACADLLAKSYHATFGLPVAITRCGNLYGGGDLNFNRLIPGTIRSILRGQRPLIRSNGQYVRDYFYVEDAAAAYLCLAEQVASRPELHGEAFNFSNEEPAKVVAVTARLLRLLDSDLQPDVRDEARHEILQQYLSAAKARRTLGWQPLLSMDQALGKTVDWYRDYFASGG